MESESGVLRRSEGVLLGEFRVPLGDYLRCGWDINNDGNNSPGII